MTTQLNIWYFTHRQLCTKIAWAVWWLSGGKKLYILHTLSNGPGVHLAPCTVRTGIFPGGKPARVWWLPPISSGYNSAPLLYFIIIIVIIVINIQHAPLHSNTTCFKEVFIVWLHVFTIYVQFLLFSVDTVSLLSIFLCIAYCFLIFYLLHY